MIVQVKWKRYKNWRFSQVSRFISQTVQYMVIIIVTMEDE